MKFTNPARGWAVSLILMLTASAAWSATPGFTLSPTAENTTSAGMDVVASTELASTMYAVAVAAGSGVPSVTQITAGRDASNAPALAFDSAFGTSFRLRLPALGAHAGKALDVHVVAVDPLGDPSVIQSLTEALFVIDDDFGGLEGGAQQEQPLNAYTTYNPSALSVVQWDGRYYAEILDNSDDRTLWYKHDQGRLDGREWQFPFTVIARNVGIAPIAQPDVEFPTPGYAFAGLQVHSLDLDSRFYSFAVVGHRGSTVYTIEGKNTVPTGPGSGSSSVTDEDDFALGQAITHADLKLIGLPDGTIRAYYQVPNPDWRSGAADAWIAYGDNGGPNGSGEMPGSNDYGAVGDSVYVGLITFTNGQSTVPLAGTADAIEASVSGMGAATACAADASYDLEVVDSQQTLLHWTPIPGAVSYDVIRGDLSGFSADGSASNLGNVTCLENDSIDTTTAGGAELPNPDSDTPLPGEGFFYLLRFADATQDQPYGETNECAPERIVVTGDCPAANIDSDGDGVADAQDLFPDDPTEWEDTDGDGVGNNADFDDDNDGIADADDPFPLVPDGICIVDSFYGLELADPQSTLLNWAAIPAAVSYDVIRGDLSALFINGASVQLGSVLCLENDSVDTTTGAGTEPTNPDSDIPLSGEGFFYLLRFNDGAANQPYGEFDNCPLERVADSSDCL